MSVLNPKMIDRRSLLVLFLSLLFIACGTQPQVTPVKVNDFFGRTVSLEKPAVRIIPTFYSEAEILCALGLKERIVGIGFIHNNAKAPQSYILNRFMPEAYELPSVGRGNEISVETVITLKPDLVITENQPEVVERLEGLGIATIALFPQKVDDVLNEINALGILTDQRERAGRLAKFLESIIDKVRMRTDRLSESERPSIYYVRSDLLTTVGDAGHGEIFRMSGGKNVHSSTHSPYSVGISLENLLQWNPEVIIIRDRSPLTIDDILLDSRLADISAVKSKKVFKEHPGWMEFRLETPFGIVEKAKWIHPELFQDMSAESEFSKFVGLVEEFNKQK